MDDEAEVRRWVAAARRPFVGRRRELEIVRSNLVDDVPPTMIFAVTGEPGVGKTTLLRRLRADLRGTAVTAWVDGPGYHPLTIIRRLAAELRRHVDTFELDEGLAAEAQASRRRGLLPLTPGTVPPHRSDAVERLTPLLMAAIDRTISQGAMVVLFLDDLGWPDHEVGHWLVDVMGGVHGQFWPEFLVVIAGDASCTAPLVRYPFAVTPLGLTRFTAEETEELVAARGLPLARAAAVHVDSGGLPAFVDLLTHPWLGERPRQAGRDRPDPVVHLLEAMPDRDLARAFLRTAVPRWTQDHLPDAVYRGRRREALVEWMRTAPAVATPRRHAPGRHWHPAVREALLGHLRAHEPKRLAAAHQRLARHHERRWLELDASGPMAAWHRVETDYHEVAASESPTDAAATVAARILAHGPAAVPSMVAAEQALRERGVAGADYRSLVAALACDDVAGAVALASKLGVGAPPAPRAERRAVALVRWAVDAAAPAEPAAPGQPADDPSLLDAVVAWYEGRFDEAERLATGGLASASDDGLLRTLRGDARLRRGDPAGAYGDLTHVGSWAAGTGARHARLGIAALGLGRAADAAEELGLALRHEHDPVLAGLRGEANRRLGDLGAAAADLASSVRSDAGSPWVHRVRALVASAAHDDAGALRHLRRAAALAPGSARLLADRAAVRRRAGDLDGALDDVTDALACLVEGLGGGVSLLGPADRASAYGGGYEQLVVAVVDEVALHLQRAALLVELGDGDAARRAFDAAVLAGADRPEVYRARSRFLALECDVPAALEDVDRWILLEPANAEAHAEHGRLSLAVGDAHRAVDAFTRAIDIEPGAARYRALRGASRRALGDQDGTIDDHTDALRLGFDEYWLRGQRSEAYLAAGDLRAARTDLEVALRHRPDESWLLGLHTRLAAAAASAGD